MLYRVTKGIILILILLSGLTGCSEISTKTANPVESTLITSTPRPQTASPALVTTAIPTLSAQDTHRLLSELLQTNSGCRLPCWWHITPGVSSVQDAEKILDPLLSAATYNSSSPTTPSGIALKYPVGELLILFRLAYYIHSSSGSEIDSIRIHTEGLHEIPDGYEPVYGAPVYSDLFDKYLIPSIMSTYGRPAQVILSLELGYSEPTSPDTFTIWLLYPEQGAILSYTGSGQVVGDSIRVCPQRTVVSLVLMPVDRNDLFQKTLSEIASGWEGLVPTTPSFKPIEEATDMPLEEFYKVFGQPTDQCLETPLVIWPR